jgi:fatty acid desaturase
MVAAMSSIPELGTLRAELRAAGVFEHCELRSYVKLGGLLAVTAAGLVGIAYLGWVAALFLVPVVAVFATAAAMTGHEGSHRAFSTSPARNAMMNYFTYPLFSGLGSLYWKDKHDRLHHGHPNVEGLDPDIKPFPFASTRRGYEESGRLQKWFQRNFQGWAFWPLTSLMAMGMRRSSIAYLMDYPRKHGFTRAWFLDSGCMVLHYTGWLLIPSLIWGPLVAFALYSALWGIVGILLALIFAPAHIGLPIVTDQNHDWLHQVETTRNLQLPRIVSFFFIGLDYQVEHHLFPKIPHHNLPRAAAITEAWCKRHGINYRSEPYWEALADSAQFMNSAWQRDADDAMEVRLGLVGRAAA